MPTYEYRCPKGHTFDLFQRMSEPPAKSCEVCGARPVTKVMHPVSIHFKGSGFYSTDYGRGGRKRDGKDSDSSGDSKSESGKSEGGKSESGKSETKADDSKAAEKKPAIEA